jgi:hypothetical protein
MNNAIPPDFAAAERKSGFVLATVNHKVEFDSIQVQKFILWAALAALSVGMILRILQRLLR